MSSSAATAAHLLFAAGTTAYILAAIRWEERDLVAAHPEEAWAGVVSRPRRGGASFHAS